MVKISMLDQGLTIKKDVTPANFLDVLKGTASGKSLKSNSDSKVFMCFADHGAPGILGLGFYQLYANDFH
jgi:hypothetical protein